MAQAVPVDNPLSPISLDLDEVLPTQAEAAWTGVPKVLGEDYAPFYFRLPAAEWEQLSETRADGSIRYHSYLYGEPISVAYDRVTLEASQLPYSSLTPKRAMYLQAAFQGAATLGKELGSTRGDYPDRFVVQRRAGIAVYPDVWSNGPVTPTVYTVSAELHLHADKDGEPPLTMTLSNFSSPPDFTKTSTGPDATTFHSTPWADATAWQSSDGNHIGVYVRIVDGTWEARGFVKSSVKSLWQARQDARTQAA